MDLSGVFVANDAGDGVQIVDDMDKTLCCYDQVNRFRPESPLFSLFSHALAASGEPPTIESRDRKSRTNGTAKSHSFLSAESR